MKTIAAMTSALHLAVKLCAGMALCLVAAGALAAPATDAGPASDGADHVFRLAVSSGMFAEVNESDARAAMKVWIMTVATERHIAVDPDPCFFHSVNELTESCRTNPLDGVGMVTPDYPRLSLAMKFDCLGVGDYGGHITEQYVVLVRRDSGFERLDQLEGHTLNVLNSARTSLATIWLDTMLLESGRKSTADFFQRINRCTKASLTTLPVFFRQADACLTTSNSFKLMGELNPQLAGQLRVLVASPEYLPAGFAFCAHPDAALRPQILKAMTQMTETPAGRQMLTLVKADRIVEAPLSSLDSALELLSKHARLCGKTNQTKVATQ